MSDTSSNPSPSTPDEGPALHPVAPTQLGPENPGLPLLRSWGAVYLVVAGVFALWATLLYVFMRTFS
jgi:hypothetical protein